MFRMPIILFLSFVLLSATGSALLAADQVKSTPWKISGQLEEACRCNGACPCWFGKKPTHSTCGGGQVLFITKGHSGNVSLEGLAVAQMTETPEGKSMVESMGSAQFDTLYIDEKANEQQRSALREISSQVFPPWAAKREIRYVPITRKIEGKEHHVTLGQYGGFSAHLIQGGMGGNTKIVNPPLADPIHKEYLQGETTKMTYTDSGRNWNFEKSNYMFNNFEADSESYAKFNAEMAKKMEQMKQSTSTDHKH
jgi:hypothetical protein